MEAEFTSNVIPTHDPDPCALSSGFPSPFMDKNLYPHLVKEIRVVETHISFVYLTGDFAYKRKFYCEEELRLNRRCLPAFYVAVVSLVHENDGFRLSDLDDPKAIEYAVQMVQFSQSELLSQVAREGRLTSALVDEAASEIARFHSSIAADSSSSDFGSPSEIHKWSQENFDELKALLDPSETIRFAHLLEIETWSKQQEEEHFDLFLRRKCEGFVRETHGDLHLDNMILHEGKIGLFDCLEFNDELRWTDTVADIAFLVMDLRNRGFRHLSRRFLNAYLEETGDYEGLQLLNYYCVYRTMVRAKVTLIRMKQTDASSSLYSSLRETFSRYMVLALSYSRDRTPMLIVNMGVSGSGKSFVSTALVEALGAVRIRTDVERKRLCGLRREQSSESPLNGGIYTEEVSKATYARCLELSAYVLRGGRPAIVDGTFLKSHQRLSAMDAARAAGVPFIILNFTAPESLCRERIRLRSRDASEANDDILSHQLKSIDPLAPDEKLFTVTVDTSSNEASAPLIERLAEAIVSKAFPQGLTTYVKK